MQIKSIALLLAFGLFFYGAGNVSAYDELTTHPALTDVVIDFYNLSYPSGQITLEERELIVEGSVSEDQPPRWINHFYDPVHNVAWTGENAGFIPSSVVQTIRAIGLSAEDPLTSVNWVNNRPVQERYSLYGGDRTWDKALEYYERGEKEEAYRTLGYVLHLIEDATVPEHTRDDPHAHALRGVTGDYGSPYEEYAKQWTRETISGLQIAGDLKNNGMVPARRGSIEDHITSAATYSNKHFFTKDTINDPKYEFPKIVREDGDFGYGLDENNLELPLVKVGNRWNEQGGRYETKYEILDKPAYYPILDAYFLRLSRKAVIEGAGAIQLFKKQAEARARDYEVNKEFPNRLVVFNSNATNLFDVPTISLFGELYKIYDTTKSLFGDFGGLAIAVYDSLIATVDTGQNIELVPAGYEAAQVVEGERAEDVLPFAEEFALEPEPAPAQEPEPVSEFIVDQPVSQPETELSAQPEQDLELVLMASVTEQQGEVLGDQTTSPQTDASGGDATSKTTAPIVSWGVSATPPPSFSSTGGDEPALEGEPPAEELPTTSTLPAIENFSGEFNVNRLEIDFIWSPLETETEIYALSLVGVEPILIATTTNSSLSVEFATWGEDVAYSLQAFGISADPSTSLEDAFEPLSDIVTTAVSVPDWLLTIQKEKSEESHPSHYGDNWYQLGTGFYGTIYAMMFGGRLDAETSQPSRVNLQEFLDSGYTALNKTFIVSEDAHFTAEKSFVTIKDLNIPLQPNKFYRLRTEQAEQNRSVILSGSSVSTTAEFTGGGTAMRNVFVSGVGRVEETYDFYPFLQIVAEKEVPEQSAPTAPEILSLSFSGTNLTLGVTWASSTDVDTGDNLLTYEFNYATSSDEGSVLLNEENWQEVSGFSYAINLKYPSVASGLEPSFYTVGARAKDDQGNVSEVATSNWSFPENFVPLVLGNHVNPGLQTFVPKAGGNVKSISVSTAEFITSSRNPATNICSLGLYEVGSTSTFLIASSDTPNNIGGDRFAYRGSGCAGDLVFTYASEPEIFIDRTYQWRFGITFSSHVKFYGYATSTIEGEFNDSIVADAKFTVEGADDTLLSN